MYLANPNDPRIRDLEATHRVPKTKDQMHIPCLVCLLPFARRTGERTIKGTKFDLLKCDAALALHKTKKGYYMCALCPLCMANEDIQDDIYHSCAQTPIVYPADMTEEEAVDYRSILKLGDTCPCLFKLFAHVYWY